MLDRGNPYFRQVALVVRVLPLVASESCFALKGGTAINLFVRDLPRLSVDIDLTYLPLDDRDDALAAIEEGLGRIADNIRRVIQVAKITAAAGEAGRVQRLLIAVGGVGIKVEVSPVLRGSVMSAELMAISDPVADQFGYVEIQVLAADELYAGKLVAALDRQHPRDLFDVKQLLAGGGIKPALMDCFVVYLVSSNRPIAELLDPHPLPLQPVFDQQFKGMTLREVRVEELNQARASMIQAIGQRLTDDHKAFLLSFKSGDPQWDLLEHGIASDLPAVQWKLRNIRKMSPARRALALSRLEMVLYR
ncbi:MAG: nucleotidyl transferase AbiEii/AbiGii toxin family protein [Halioglobus sp.]|nr:nucleotidyl transferase AbiEii/AbiGii toxin family protein [Halioglobus sp.]